MTSTPAGWYQDPDQSGRQRYWDGVRWTEHYDAPAAPLMPPGWYPDPDVAQQNRYWDGEAWTQQVQTIPLFDGMVAMPYFAKRKEKHLLVTNDEMVWGEDRILWDDVRWFTQLIVIENGAEAQFEIRITHGDLETGILFGRSSMRDRTPRHAYDCVIGQLRRTLGVRVVNGLLEMVDAGESVRTAGLLFAPEGFGELEKGELVPWADFAGIEVGGHEGIYVRLFAMRGGKRKQAFRVKVGQLHAWAVPPVVEAFARRYGPPAG